jgi:hypothetical protein
MWGSILIHEIVEIRLLKAKGLEPLRQQTEALQRLLAQNIEAHIIATYEEHLYLQEGGVTQFLIMLLLTTPPCRLMTSRKVCAAVERG